MHSIVFSHTRTIVANGVPATRSRRRNIRRANRIRCHARQRCITRVPAFFVGIIAARVVAAHQREVAEPGVGVDRLQVGRGAHRHAAGAVGLRVHLVRAEEVLLRVLIGAEGKVLDVVPDSPAAKAGIAPGAKLVAVNSRDYTDALMKASMRVFGGTLPSEQEMEFAVTCTQLLDEKGGPR